MLVCEANILQICEIYTFSAIHLLHCQLCVIFVYKSYNIAAMSTPLNAYPHLKDLRVKIFTRSFSFELYRYAQGLFSGLGIPVVRLTDQMADGYFYTMLQDTTCDVAINIDEDAFLSDPQAMLSLADEVIGQGYANAGVSDADQGCPRIGNPLVTNPFFNVLNLSLIRTKFSLDALKAFSYDRVKQQMIDAFPSHVKLQKHDFQNIDYEPYYTFFLWLAYNFRTCYLPATRHVDGTSTIVYDTLGRPFLLHSWFARFYKMTEAQTIRIDSLIDEAYRCRGIMRPVFTPRDYRTFKYDLLKRWLIKIPMRIMNWPNKWAKWYRRWRRKHQLKP